jgi:hypothetical protein
MEQETNMERIERMLRAAPVEHPSEGFRERLRERLLQAEHSRSPNTLLRLEEWLLGFSLLAILSAAVLFADLGFIGHFAFESIALLPEWLMQLHLWFLNALDLLSRIPILGYLTAVALVFLWFTDRLMLRWFRQQKSFLLSL